MPRSKTSDGKRITICAKISEPVADAIDAARGEQSRSAWLQSAVMAGLRDSATRLAVQAVSGKPEPAARRSRKPESGAASQCPPHPKARVIKGLCGACGQNVS